MTKTKSRTRRRYADEDDAFDERGVLRDGHSTRLPLMMRDSLQDDIARSTAGRSRLEDSAGRRPGNRPGFVFDSSGSNAETRKAYAEHDAWLRDAHLNQPPTGDSLSFVGQRAGDVCTVRSGGGKYGPEGAPGHLKNIDGELVCVADQQQDALTGDARSIALAEHEQWLTNAWRGAQ
jgi:hypothetical protein